jgi:hypothetical protein
MVKKPKNRINATNTLNKIANTLGNLSRLKKRYTGNSRILNKKAKPRGIITLLPIYMSVPRSIRPNNCTIRILIAEWLVI